MSSVIFYGTQLRKWTVFVSFPLSNVLDQLGTGHGMVNVVEPR
jgi:hypothetical protein